MKQTNNAIKFLMAQYRAIFKNANLAMAVALATAALAAGQAQAAASDGMWDAADFGSANDTSSGAETVTKDSVLDMSGITVGNDAFAYSSGDSTITSGAAVTVNGSANKHLALEGLKVQSGGSLQLINTAETNTQIFGYKSGSGAGSADVGTLTVDNGSVEIQKGSINFNKADIKNGSTITLGGIVDYNKKADTQSLADWKHYSNIYSITSGSNSGSFGISGSTINLNHESLLGSQDAMTIKGSTLNFNGQMHEKGHATAFLTGTTDSGAVTIEGSTLNVNGDGGIYSGKIEVNDATANIAADKKLILDGRWKSTSADDAGSHSGATVTLGDFTVNGAGTLVIGNVTSGSTVTISGTTTINSALENNSTITVTGDDHRGLIINAADFKKDAGLFAGKSSTLTLQSGGNLELVNHTGTLDLADTEQVVFTSGNASHNQIKVSGDASFYTDGAIAISGKISNLSGNLSVGAPTLTVGSDKFDSKTSDLGIGKGILYATDSVTLKSSGDEGFFLKNELELNATGNGVIDGLISVSGGKVSIISGNYTADKGIKVVSGASNQGLSVANGSLKVKGAFETTATNGLVSLTGATLDISEAASYKLGSGTITMADASTLILDGSKWFTLGTESGKLVEFQADVAANAVSGDAISTLKLTGVSAMTMEQFKELKTDTGFTGLFEGFTVNSDTPMAPSIEVDKVETGTPDNVYQNTQAQVGAAVADKTLNVGSVGLTGTTAELSLTSTNGSNLTLTNAAANGNANNNFVQKADGSVAGVSMSGDNTVLVLKGDGNIGAISAAASGNGVLSVGSLDGSQTGDVVVKGNIGENKALGVVQASNYSSLTVEGTVVNANEFHVMPHASVFAQKADITVAGSTDAVTMMGDITANSLTFTAKNAEHMIAGGANITVNAFTGASGTTVQVGDDAEGGLGATIVTSTLSLNDGTIFVDPSYGNEASKVIVGNLDNAQQNTAGELKGNVYIGKNAAMGIGYDSEAEFNAVLADYVDANGSFSDAAGKTRNALIVNKPLTVASGKEIMMDASLTAAPGTPGQNKVTIGAGSNLIITDSALANGAAITFASNNGTVAGQGTGADAGKISLYGDFDSSSDGAQIFAGATSVTGTVAVEVAGGLFMGTLSNTGAISGLTIQQGMVDEIRANTSAPVGQYIIDYKSAQFTGSNKTLNDLIDNKAWGAIDAAAHAATYAGAQQAAVASVTTMADAVVGRVGTLGVEAAAISATGSQANGGVWLTPMYKSMDSDGFDAQGVSYGSDVDLAGVAFGADTVNGNMRFGAVFNLGSGDSEGKGYGNGLKDDFDYYGFGIYSAMGFGAFALVGDASLTVISHDVEGLGMRGKADTSAVTMGVTGQYTFATPAVDVTPHLGARFIRLDTDSYDLTSDAGVFATTDFDVQNVFSIPLGVTLSKAFTTGGWALAPSADLTLTFNTGDTDVSSKSTINGISGAMDMSTEVLDEVQYGLTLGASAQFGAFGTTFGVNYTGSSNTDSFGVNAQARYVF